MFNALKMFAERNTDVGIMCARGLYQTIATKPKPHHEGRQADCPARLCCLHLGVI